MTATDEQVERVARALWDADWSTWPEGYTANRERFHFIARAAIAALQPQGDGLAELRALSERAMPGEWELAGDEYTEWAAFVCGPNGKALCEIYPDNSENGPFIVACVNHIRAELERTKG